MGIKIERKKNRNLLLSIIYRFSKLIPLSKERKFKLFLNLEWIFDRISHEISFSIYSVEEHPFRIYTNEFLKCKISIDQIVLDLGCKYGEMTNSIADYCKNIIGVDVDKEAIKIAKSKYNKENISFEHANALSFLSSNNLRFDVLILSHIMEHLDNPKLFLLDYKLFFKYIYIEVPDFDRYYLNSYRKKLNMDLIYSDNDHIWEFDRYELKDLLTNCNIDIIESEYIHGVQRLWCKVNK